MLKYGQKYYQMTCLPSAYSPAGFCKTDKLDRQYHKGKTNSSRCLLRRLPFSSSKRRDTADSSGLDKKVAKATRVAFKPRKNRSGSGSTIRVFRHHMEYAEQYESHQYRETGCHKVSIRNSPRKEEMELVTSQKAPGSPDICVFRDKAGQTSLPLSAKRFQQNQQIPIINNLRPVERISSGLSVVVNPAGKQDSYSRGRSIRVHDNRRVRHWVGCHSKWFSSQRNMDRGSKEVALQPEGNVGRVSSTEELRNNSERKNVPNSVRQQDSRSLYPKTRRNEVTHTPAPVCRKSFSTRKI